MEKYQGAVTIAFDDIPSIQLVSIISSENAGLLERLALATQARQFTLRDSWQVNISGVEYADDINGTIEIPDKDASGNKIVFDGASIPFPWLISLLTIGILRPLGVMLTGSIVHDYTYKYGSLRVMKSGSSQYVPVKLPRHKADKLFRNIIGTVNGMPLVGYIGWFSVRLGWPWVKYNGKRFGSKKPMAEYLILCLILATIVWFSGKYHFHNFLTGFMYVYIGFYLFSLFLKKVLFVKK